MKKFLLLIPLILVVFGGWLFFSYYPAHSYEECGFSIKYPYRFIATRINGEYGPHPESCKKALKIDLPDPWITIIDKADHRLIINVYNNVDKFKTVEELLLYRNDVSEGNKYPNIPTAQGGLDKEQFEWRKNLPIKNGFGLAIPDRPWDWTGRGPNYYFFYALSRDGDRIIHISCSLARGITVKRCNKIISTLEF